VWGSVRFGALRHLSTSPTGKGAEGRRVKEPLKNLDILFFVSAISVSSVVFQQFKSTTEGTEFTEQAFSEVP
jgi:hypothetical protein